MKVGDLVGVIIGNGVYTGNNDVKVMWNNEEITTYKSRDLRIIE